MIEVSNLVKMYGDRLVLDNVTFSIKKGEIVGLLGLNGAGKSTTMNILTGCLSKTGGVVEIDGQSYDDHANQIKKKIGYLPEIPPLYVDMTVNEYLSFVYDLKKVVENKQEHIAYVCQKAGIADMRKRLIKNLSKGYKQRVGIAASLLGNPDILIFDEPTVGLDPNQIIEIRNLISEMGKEHTVILSSHILSEVQSVCERIIVLKQGKIVADNSPDALRNEYLNRISMDIHIKGDQHTIQQTLESMDNVYEVTLKDEIRPSVFVFEVVFDGQDKTKEDLFYACSNKQLPILAMASNSKTLEDVFLSLVKDDNKEEDQS